MAARSSRSHNDTLTALIASLEILQATSNLIATVRRSQDSDNSQSNAAIHIYTVRRGIGMDGYIGVIETTLIENIS